MNKSKTIETIAIIVIMVLIVASCAVIAVNAEDDPLMPVRTAKQEALHEAADLLRACGYANDSNVIKALGAAWMQEQENLDIIAKVIQHEADPQWCEWEHSVSVGAVVCNRVRSEWFPNSVKEVVAAPGQYLKSYTYDFSGVSRLAYLAAKAALDGEHDVPADCYWQDTKKQGVSVWKAFELDTGWYKSTTYICRGIPEFE